MLLAAWFAFLPGTVQAAQWVEVEAEMAKIYDQPAEDSAVLYEFPAGTRLRASDRARDGWRRVLVLRKDGKPGKNFGWVRTADLLKQVGKSEARDLRNAGVQTYETVTTGADREPPPPKRYRLLVLAELAPVRPTGYYAFAGYDEHKTVIAPAFGLGFGFCSRPDACGYLVVERMTYSSSSFALSANPADFKIGLWIIGIEGEGRFAVGDRSSFAAGLGLGGAIGTLSTSSTTSNLEASVAAPYAKIFFGWRLNIAEGAELGATLGFRFISQKVFDTSVNDVAGSSDERINLSGVFLQFGAYLPIF
jgi:hypothetical protein